MIKYFVGIDVQIKRGCCYYIIDENKKYFASGWIKDNIPQSFRDLFFKINRSVGAFRRNRDADRPYV